MATASDAPACLVHGSLNVDEFFHLPHIVRPGETLSSTSFDRKAGGKGANQACAVARAGARVELAGQVGKDGEWLRGLLEGYGVGVEGVRVDEDTATGRAVIQISKDGENSIVLFPGTNVLPYPLPALHPPKHTHLLLQNEILPIDTTSSLLLSHSSGVTSVYNPSPMPSPAALRDFPWHALSWLIVNEGEARDLVRALQGGDSIKEDLGAERLLGTLEGVPGLRGVKGLVVTLGAEGVVAAVRVGGEERRTRFKVDAAKVKVVNTTGAGDTFAGYFVASLMRLSAQPSESDIQLALQTAVIAAGLAVTRPGAMESIPSAEEVVQFAKENGLKAVGA